MKRLFGDPELRPSPCISLETLVTSSWDRPSVRTSRTLGTPFLTPPSSVRMLSFTCWMARPDWTEGKLSPSHNVEVDPGELICWHHGLTGGSGSILIALELIKQLILISKLRW